MRSKPVRSTVKARQDARRAYDAAGAGDESGGPRGSEGGEAERPGGGGDRGAGDGDGDGDGLRGSGEGPGGPGGGGRDGGGGGERAGHGRPEWMRRGWVDWGFGVGDLVRGLTFPRAGDGYG